MTIAEQIGLFSKLSPDARARILANTVQKEYEADDYVFFEGDGPAHLWFLEQGRVKLLKHSDTGKDVIVTVISAGSFIGGAASPDKTVYPVTAQAIEPSRLRVFPEHAYIEMLRLYPDVSVLIIHGLEQRLNEAYDTIRSMAVERVERRIARLLLKLAGSLGKPAGGDRILIDMPLSRQEIAEMTGTTVESAIRVMSKFRKQGLVESKDGKVSLVKPHALVRIADEL